MSCPEPQSRTAARASSRKSSLARLEDEPQPTSRWVDMTCHTGTGTATHFRFQLVGCELMSCDNCTRHFLTPEPSTVVCPRCHHLIAGGCHVDAPSLFDMERLLLTNGLFFAGCPTSLTFMRLKSPRMYSHGDDAWSDVVVAISDAALRIYELDNGLTASFGWGSLSLHFSESTETPEMVLKDRNARHMVSAPSPAVHRWLKSRILNKLNLYSTQALLDNSFTHFRPVQVPTEPEKPAKPKAFLSRLRNGKFLRKRETPFSPPPCPAPRSEALMPFAHRPRLSQKAELPIFLHRLASRSLPNIALACATKKGSRISAATFATQSSADSALSTSPPTSNLGLDFLFSAPFPDDSEPSLVHFLLNNPDVYPPEKPIKWQPVDCSTLGEDCETRLAPLSPTGPLFPPLAPQASPPKSSAPLVLESPASLLPQQVRTHMLHQLRSKSAVQLRAPSPPMLDCDALIDMFPTPPSR